MIRVAKCAFPLITTEIIQSKYQNIRRGLLKKYAPPEMQVFLGDSSQPVFPPTGNNDLVPNPGAALESLANLVRAGSQDTLPLVNPVRSGNQETLPLANPIQVGGHDPVANPLQAGSCDLLANREAANTSSRDTSPQFSLGDM